ncbi:hypothetical protein N3Z17_05225 [Candidatus Bandiella numerosa]|nr:hypothetical protein [Candidatus Bandiella numerosa]WHA04624.1 hypothetical protein N3Z17_05225 [Candidatus Bandiella numerosa]
MTTKKSLIGAASTSTLPLGTQLQCEELRNMFLGYKYVLLKQ